MFDAKQPARLLIPALGPFYDTIRPFLYPVFRAVVGLMLIPHGVEKLQRGVDIFAAGNPAKLGFTNPTAWGWAVVVLETLGAVCIAAGLFTRFFAAAAAIEMAFIAFGVHMPLGWFWTGRGFEYPFMWGVMLALVAFNGSGNYSVDRNVLGREL
jgi:putative oxidoreductase